MDIVHRTNIIFNIKRKEERERERELQGVTRIEMPQRLASSSEETP